MSIETRFPYLFEVYAKDAGGRPQNMPNPPANDPNALEVIGHKTPTPAQLVLATLSQFGYPVGMSVAVQIVSDLDELAALTAAVATPTPAAAPPTTPPPTTPTEPPTTPPATGSGA